MCKIMWVIFWWSFEEKSKWMRTLRGEIWYIYIYIYIHTYLYIYIYTYISIYLYNRWENYEYYSRRNHSVWQSGTLPRVLCGFCGWRNSFKERSGNGGWRLKCFERKVIRKHWINNANAPSPGLENFGLLQGPETIWYNIMVYYIILYNIILYIIYNIILYKII